MEVMSDVIERTELLVPGPAQALGALLCVSLPDLDHGAGLLLLWHWVYLLDRPTQADLGADGHPCAARCRLRCFEPFEINQGFQEMHAGGRTSRVELDNPRRKIITLAKDNS